MLEKMGAFFEARLAGYDKHMMTNIQSAEEFYPFTARCLPRSPGAKILDLGCGTGLELGEYFVLNPTARVAGIDLAAGMLRALEKKFPERDMTLICGKLRDALKEGGVFILTDYFSLSDEEECRHRAELLRLKIEQGITDDAFYHYDTPLTVRHETEALLAAGFTTVEVLRNWGQTFTLRAKR